MYKIACRRALSSTILIIFFTPTRQCSLVLLVGVKHMIRIALSSTILIIYFTPTRRTSEHCLETLLNLSHCFLGTTPQYSIYHYYPKLSLLYKRQKHNAHESRGNQTRERLRWRCPATVENYRPDPGQREGLTSTNP
jgi:hypothetical protein